MYYFNSLTKLFILISAIEAILLTFSSCALLGIDNDQHVKPIANPFYSYRNGPKNDASQSMILRTKKGDRSIELEIPGDSERLSEFVLPMSPAFKDSTRTPASSDNSSTGTTLDESYKNRSASMSDREITRGFPQGSQEDQSKLRQIEKGLNLSPSDDDSLTESNPSYLASMDHIKQLYRSTRYEAALIETDEMIRIYQTDSKLHQMRGTLLDRLGRNELALKAWTQALRFDPKNGTLRKFIDRKQFRSTAGTP
jgi:hypothetical protein